MIPSAKWIAAALLFMAVSAGHAQVSLQTSGTLVIVPAEGIVRQANDEAKAIFMVEEQDRDKAAAASRVNLKIKQGTDILKREDPQARLKTYGYYTYPVYPEDQQPRPAGKARQPSGWRVGQYLEATTGNLAGLSKTVAAVQRILALNGLQFGLSDAASKKLDEQRIDTAYRSLTERIAAIAKAMGRKPSDAVLDTVDFEASGAYGGAPEPMLKTARAAAAADAVQVEEPSFEPGETVLQMRVVGKVKIK